MKKQITFLFLTVVLLNTFGQRDPYRWPFDKFSIWNMPIHNSAEYVPSAIQEAGIFEVDEDVIITFPNEPVMNVETNYAEWGGGDRCPDEGPVLSKGPIPSWFIYDQNVWIGRTPNAGAAILKPTGEIIQTQPFAKCNENYATSRYMLGIGKCQLKGECIEGAHGGSGMSSIGGAIRVGEFSKGEINHVLKINLWGKENIYGGGTGHRWPATHADGGYNVPGHFNQYAGTNPEVVMGSLLAIHKDVNLHSLDSNALGLETVPGLIIARTLQKYGAYLVDNTGQDAYAIITEHGPMGTVTDEFKDLYGYTMNKIGDLKQWAWGRDIDRIFKNLYVVVNNDPDNIGGGPTQSEDRLAPFAPDFTTSGNSAPFAVFKMNPKTGTAPLNVCFDASKSSDYNSDKITFEWVFGDGQFSTSVNPSHTYAYPGNYLVKLIVTDEPGLKDTLVKTLIVDSIVPGNVPVPGDTIWIKAGINSKFVSINSLTDAVNAPIYAKNGVVSKNEIFIVEDAGCGWNRLKAYANNKYVVCDPDNFKLYANSKVPAEASKMNIQKVFDQSAVFLHRVISMHVPKAPEMSKWLPTGMMFQDGRFFPGERQTCLK
ncbi:MAG: PKD domain-containing protein [Bacteroidales bacterium]|nr:PKD domain-containing protein [Bacteroidales bacterium]